jgi:hypothetical protein
MESFRRFWLENVDPRFDNQFYGFTATHLPTPPLDIPVKKIDGKIRSIFYTQNPITIALENGAVWKVNKDQWDYLVAIGREPKEGKTVHLEIYLDGTIKSVGLS